MQISLQSRQETTSSSSSGSCFWDGRLKWLRSDVMRECEIMWPILNGPHDSKWHRAHIKFKRRNSKVSRKVIGYLFWIPLSNLNFKLEFEFKFKFNFYWVYGILFALIIGYQFFSSSDLGTSKLSNNEFKEILKENDIENLVEFIIKKILWIKNHFIWSKF